MKEKASRSGQTVVFTRATGTTTKPITLVAFFIKMETFIRVNGRRKKLTALAITSTRMAHCIVGSGRMTPRMGREWSAGPMVQSSKAATHRA